MKMVKEIIGFSSMTIWIRWFIYWTQVIKITETDAYGKLNIHKPNGRISPFEKVPYKNNRKNAFIKIMSEDDDKLYKGEKKIIIPTFEFNDKFKTFNDIYEYYQINKIVRK